MKLSKNFELGEFLVSQTATRQGFKEQFTPPDQVIDNLQCLCVRLLQPLRDSLPGVMRVSSGYRCERLNKQIGSTPNSQHVKGQVADIQYYEDDIMDNQKLLDKLNELKLEYDQCLWEFGGQWLHLSYNYDENRNQFLKIG